MKIRKSITKPALHRAFILFVLCLILLNPFSIRFISQAFAQTEAEILQLLQQFQSNPSKANAMQVLRHSAKVEELNKAGKIPGEFSGTLWDIDDVKVDIMKQKIGQAGQNYGNDFQMSIYGSDSARPPTRAELTAQMRAQNPSVTEAQVDRALGQLRSNTRYDAFRSDWDMTFTGPKAREASRFMQSQISAEFNAEGITIDPAADLGFNPLSYPETPGRGYDLRVKYLANQEMYNSRGGTKWIQRQMWNNGKITYYDSNLGRMVTQNISEYSGSAKLPFKPPQPLTQEELFGFLADNYNQMQQHLAHSKNSGQRLKWMSKYLERSVYEFPPDFLNRIGMSSSDIRMIQEAARTLESGTAGEAQRHFEQLESLYSNVITKVNEAQMEMIASRIANNVEKGLSILGDQKLFMMIQELSGTYANLGIRQARQLVEAARATLGEGSDAYKAFYTALQQAQDLRDEAELLRLIEEHLAAGRPVPVKITRPSRPGQPVEAKIES
ncbi:hypothetical protein ACFLT9_11580, partial [Acidobacteriota bacterium]